jgi:serine protease Do
MRKIFWIALASFTLGLLAASFIFVYHPESKDTAEIIPAKTPSPSVSSNLYAGPAETRADLDFVKISERVGPAVVKILSEKVIKRNVPDMGGDQWPFEDFWDRFFGRPGGQREQPLRQDAQGSGFFTTQDGYIITNNHIVENAAKVTVTALDQTYTAKVIGADPKSDLALIKIEAKNMPSIDLGDSSQLKVGEWVLAIGNPFGMEHTVTAGIVSAKGRQLGTGMNVPDYQDFIQTDTAINMGNSGGPLVNMRGEVIGITSNILSPSGGSIGIGFAIPSNLAKKVIAQLKEKGRVVRGKLGVTIMPITEDEKKSLNLTSNKGALVNSVEPDGPADKAGIKRYDVIIEINGQPIVSNNELKFKIADIEPGTKVEIKLIRDGKEKIVTATIIELEPQEEKSEAAGTEKDLGLSITALTANLARRYGLQSREGLLITEVRRYSEADRKNIEAGDIILEVNRRRVASVAEFQNILRRAKSGDPIMLLIRRESDGEVQDAIVTLRVP